MQNVQNVQKLRNAKRNIPSGRKGDVFHIIFLAHATSMSPHALRALTLAPSALTLVGTHSEPLSPVHIQTAPHAPASLGRALPWRDLPTRCPRAPSPAATAAYSIRSSSSVSSESESVSHLRIFCV